MSCPAMGCCHGANEIPAGRAVEVALAAGAAAGGAAPLRLQAEAAGRLPRAAELQGAQAAGCAPSRTRGAWSEPAPQRRFLPRFQSSVMQCTRRDRSAALNGSSRASLLPPPLPPAVPPVQCGSVRVCTSIRAEPSRKTAAYSTGQR